MLCIIYFPFNLNKSRFSNVKGQYFWMHTSKTEKSLLFQESKLAFLTPLEDFLLI